MLDPAVMVYYAVHPGMKRLTRKKSVLMNEPCQWSPAALSNYAADRKRRRAETTALPLVCLLLFIGVVLLAGLGGSRKPAPPAGSSAAPPPSAGPVAAPPPAGGSGITTRAEIAGVRYLEHMTGGARPDERVPMIVALHPMGGDPADFLQLFRRYRRRARLILPYGHPNGGMYIWYDSVRDDVAASMVTREADRIAAVLAALVAARPTAGKPLSPASPRGES